MKLWLLVLVTGVVYGQTQVDLRSQSKDVDFSTATFTVPFPTGTTLPVLCKTGSMFFNTSAPAGSNMYGCVATNTWAVQAVNGILRVQQTSSTVLTIGGNCSFAVPCLVQVGSLVYSYTLSATVTLTSGSGTVYLYVDPNGNITAGESVGGAPGLSCSGCVLGSGVTQFPIGTVPLATWSASAGTWLTGNSGVSLQGSGPSFFGGNNITLTQTGNSVTIAAFLGALPSGSQPTCSVSTGGYLWYTPGATGVKDSAQVCAKDATNTYAWRTLY